MDAQEVSVRVISGMHNADDAAVYLLDDETALIFTADFITPVVDDAYAYGKIAATNSLSDIYAMGGKPTLALNLVGFPKEMPKDVMRQIIQGGLDGAKAAGAIIVGGHTVEDEEPKFGMAVIGFAHPDRLIKKGGAKAGDKLVLTKPLGTGLLAKCGKNAMIAETDLQAAQQSMMRSNKNASELAVKYGVVGGTDVTGFGLLGHAHEMAQAAGVSFRLHMSTMTFLSGAREQAQLGEYWPTKVWENIDHFGNHVSFAPTVAEYEQRLLFSPETSGGLLLSVPGAVASAFVQELHDRGEHALVIGEVEDGHDLAVDI